METVEITFSLPKELVERAQALGINIDQRSEAIISWVEREIIRQEGLNELGRIVEDLRSLPDEMKPTLEEIDEAVKQARREIYEERQREKNR